MKKIDDIYNNLDTIPGCDRQTDIQTDRHPATAYTRYAYASRSNEYAWHVSVETTVFTYYYSVVVDVTSSLMMTS